MVDPVAAISIVRGKISNTVAGGLVAMSGFDISDCIQSKASLLEDSAVLWPVRNRSAVDLFFIEGGFRRGVNILVLGVFSFLSRCRSLRRSFREGIIEIYVLCPRHRRKAGGKMRQAASEEGYALNVRDARKA